MQISLSPIRSDEELSVSKAGDVLTINGDVFDFSEVPDGATVLAEGVPCDWIIGPVERVDGELRLTLLLPHGSNPSPEVAFPEPMINPPDGQLDLPRDPEPVEENADVEA